MTETVLFFQEVSFGYQKKEIPTLSRVDLAIPKGSTTVILGPNGAGKTTLLYLALGWLKPWEGQIHLAGKPIRQYTRRSLGQRVALIPQSEHNPFEYSVIEFVLLGRSPHLPPLSMPSGEDEQIAFEALEKTGIAHLYNHSMLGLSGGEKQLVLIARALTQDPEILLLDEPTSHLDLHNKSRLIHTLLSLQKQGKTIMMTTHDPDIALAISDTGILMEKGRILSSGPTTEVLTEENLSKAFSIPVKIREIEGKKQILWL